MKNNYGNTLPLPLCCLLFFTFFTGGPYAHAAAYAPPDRANSHNYTNIVQQQVRGTVRDTNGIPLPGVTVRLKTGTGGTSTDLDGNYAISAPQNDTLIFSYVGSETQEIPINGRSVVDIQLNERATALEAVTINAGYYSTTEREATGNISKVNAGEIENQPVISPIEALQGRMAGVEVVQQSGIPGAAPTIRIRGQNSLRAGLGDNGNLPLYIIDGIPINSAPVTSINRFTNNTGLDPLSGISLSNIKSIEVLKDADATSIYGSRGANGVVLITTKGGTLNEPKDELQVQFYSGVSRVAHFLDLMGTPQYLALRRQAFVNDQVEPTASNAEDLLIWDQSDQTDWQRELFGHSAPTLNASINYSGGNKNTSFRLGASYLKQGNVFPGNHALEKKTVNLSVNHRSKSKRFTANVLVNFGLTDNDLFSASNFVETALNLSPNAPALYNDDGTLNWAESTWTNPLAALKSEGKNKTKNLLTNLGLSYVIAEGLTLKANLGYTTLDSNDDILRPKELYDPTIREFVSSQSQHFQTHRKSWIVEPQLNYNKNFDKHHLDLLLGTTFQKNTDSRLSLSGIGYANEHLLGNLNAADAVSVNLDQEDIYNYNAVFARIGYNFNHTYFLNLTGRRDGSSRFGPQNRFSNFGAIGAAWIFTENELINPLPFLSFGKLRASYGITGNDQIGDYRYLDIYEKTPGPGGLYPTRLTNPNFSWESNKKLEAAIELGLFDDLFNLDLSWYRNRSSNQLVGYTLPEITGFSSVEANLPATVQNSGLEIEVSATLVKTSNFKWQSSFNISFPKNKLIEFEGLEESPYADVYEVGQPLNIIKQYQFAGIDPDNGYYQVVDVDGNGSFDYDDRTVINDLSRQYYGGLGNQLSYKNFSVNFLLEFVKQQGLSYNSGVPGLQTNILDDGKYTREGAPSNQNIQKPTQAITGFRAYRNYLGSDERTVDASFIRMKSLNLNYTLPRKLIDHLPFSDFKIFVHGQNLFTLTDYVGLDPQNPASTNLPLLQSITGGLQLNF